MSGFLAHLMKCMCRDIDKAHEVLCDELRKEIKNRMDILNKVPWFKKLTFDYQYGSTYFDMNVDKRDWDFRGWIEVEMDIYKRFSKRYPLMEEIRELSEKLLLVSHWNTGE